MRGKKGMKGGFLKPGTVAAWAPYMWLWLGIASLVMLVLLIVSHAQKPPQVRVVVETAQALPARQMVAADAPPIYPRENPTYPLRGQQNQDFQQIGVLVSQDAHEDQPVILPLFGRRIGGRDRWEYYVASDKYHMWRLPIQFKNRMCDDDVGCEEVYQGDEVVVPDYANKVFVARIYKYAAPRYSA